MASVTLNDGYSIIRFNRSHLPAVEKLFHASYKGRTRSHSYFKYRLLNSPYGKPIIFLMKFQKQIVGLYAIHPILLKIKQKNILGGYSYLTMTHPQHAGKGIFTRLALRTYEEAIKKKYNFVYGFANTNSYTNFINKLGFVEIGQINFIKIKQTEKFEPKTKVLKGVYPKNLIDVWDRYESKNKYSIKLERNWNFINWRYKKHPTNKYFSYYNPGKYFFILKKYENIIHIIDFFGAGERFYQTLLTEASNLANKLMCNEITMWIPADHEIFDLVPRKYIKKLKWNKSFFIVKLLNKKLTRDILDINNWYYTMGDSDHF